MRYAAYEGTIESMHIMFDSLTPSPKGLGDSLSGAIIITLN